MTEAQLSR